MLHKGPASHNEWNALREIDAFAPAEVHGLGLVAPHDPRSSPSDKNRRLRGSDVHCVDRTSYRGDSVRRQDLETARPDQLNQNRPTHEFDRGRPAGSRTGDSKRGECFSLDDQSSIAAEHRSWRIRHNG